MAIHLHNTETNDGAQINHNMRHAVRPRPRSPALFTKLINSVRIYNIPTINLVIIGVLGCFLLKLTFKYNDLYTKSSLVTITISNLVLYGISETLAQTILSYNPHCKILAFELYYSYDEFEDQYDIRLDNEHQPEERSSTDSSNGDSYDEFLNYIANDDGLLNTQVSNSIPITAQVSPTFFSFSRLAGFMCWGFVMSFFQCFWYKFLHMNVKGPKLIEVIRKVLTDQICYSPVSLFAFFTYGTMVLENGSWEDAKDKLSRIYLKTLMINYCVWFPVQFINFLLVPRTYQVPFGSSISVLWNCFLSMRNSTN